MGVNGAVSVCRDGEHKKPLPPWTEGGWEVTKPSEDNLRTREIQYVQLNEIEMKDYCRSPSLPQWYQFCKPPKSKWARKFPHLEIFFKSFNCYPTDVPRLFLLLSVFLKKYYDQANSQQGQCALESAHLVTFRRFGIHSFLSRWTLNTVSMFSYLYSAVLRGLGNIIFPFSSSF